MSNHSIDSQATDSTVAPHWILQKGFYDECSVCRHNVHRLAKYEHEHWCWAHRPSLSVSNVCSFEYSSFASIDISSEASAFECVDSAYGASLGQWSPATEPSTYGDSSCSESEAITAVHGFEVTSEDVASFNCTMQQTLSNKHNGIKPYTHEFSTEDASAAIEWMDNELRSGGQFETEDIPTGDYVKAYFTADYDKAECNSDEMTGILVHDTLTTLQTYGVDIASVKYITGVDEDNKLVYIILPGYCMENTNKHTFRYTHCIDSENDLLGFVKKGTPIITKEMCNVIESAVEEYKRFDCGELLVRRFLYANKEKLINGGTFTIKDMEDAGIIDIYRKIYPDDSKNIKLGKIIGLYCDVKSKANSKVASNQRRKYGLKKDKLEYLSD